MKCIILLFFKQQTYLIISYKQIEFYFCITVNSGIGNFSQSRLIKKNSIWRNSGTFDKSTLNWHMGLKAYSS